MNGTGSDGPCRKLKSSFMPDSIQTVLDELRAAFPPHPLDTEGAFAEWGVSYTDSASFKSESHGKRWDELSPRFLEFHHDALVFLGPAALLDVIPAYLAAVLQHGPELDMLPSFLADVLTRGPSDERFDLRFRRLTALQKQAITLALETWEAALSGSRNQMKMTQTLRSYWK